MKCPKCGYVSFDYNLTCPKCNKDIAAEQQKLNLAPFRPDPPSLLGALLGHDNESNVGLQMGGSSEIPLMHEGSDVSLDDSSVLDVGEVRLDDSQEVDLGLDLESGEAEEVSEEEIVLEEAVAEADLGSGTKEEAVEEALELSVDKEEGSLEIELEKEEGEGIFLDLGDLSSESPEKEEKRPLESPEKEGNLLIDLGDLSMEESSAEAGKESRPAAKEDEEISFDLDSLSVQTEDSAKAGEKEEIALSLDDLKINETGELEIGQAVASLKDHKDSLGEKGLFLDLEEERPAGAEKENDEDFTLLLDEEDAKDSSLSDDNGITIDLENLDLDLDLDIEKSDDK